MQTNHFQPCSMQEYSEHNLCQPRTQGILLPVSENGPGIGRSHDLKISSIWGVQL